MYVCSQGGDHSETNLANSGYNMPDMKVRKTQNQDPSIFLHTYLLKLIVEIWQFEFLFYSFRNLANLCIMG